MTTVIEGQRPGSGLAALPPGPALATRPPGRGIEPDQQRMTAVGIRPGSPADTPAVTAMVSRCSPETLFHRFHGPARGTELTLAHLHQPGMAVYLAWTGPRCVAAGVLGFDDAGVGHLGVLVEDAWQRRGVGARLTRALVTHARDGGVARLHADVLVADSFLLPLLRRLGALTVSTSTGAHSVDVSLAPPASRRGS